MNAAAHPKQPRRPERKAVLAPAEIRSGSVMERSALDAWEASAMRCVQQMVGNVVSIELELSRVAKLLRISSPPVEGKMDVRWWNDHGITRPVLVRWVKQRGGKLRPKKVDRISAVRRLGTSGINADEASALAKIARRLINERAKTVARLANFSKYTRTHVMGQQGLLSILAGDVEHHGQEILRKLVRRGYSVEGKYIDLVGATEWFDAKKIGLDDDARAAGGFALIEADDRLIEVDGDID